MPAQPIPMVGRVFGEWTVLYRTDNGKRGELRWICRCSCGAEKAVFGHNLRAGESKSCASCAHRKDAERRLDG